LLLVLINSHITTSFRRQEERKTGKKGRKEERKKGKKEEKVQGRVHHHSSLPLQSGGYDVFGGRRRTRRKGNKRDGLQVFF
jgi:hypothetical protein